MNSPKKQLVFEVLPEAMEDSWSSLMLHLNVQCWFPSAPGAVTK